MKYRKPVTLGRGRWMSQIQWSSLNLPRLYVITEGYPNEAGYNCVVGFSFGNGSSDPVFFLDVDIAGTRLGRWASSLYWRWEKSRGR